MGKVEMEGMTPLHTEFPGQPKFKIAKERIKI